jgi:hypothetical protein
MGFNQVSQHTFINLEFEVKGKDTADNCVFERNIRASNQYGLLSLSAIQGD